MNGITKYFKSPTNDQQKIEENDENKPSTPSYRKNETIDQKIVHNMEKVIKSVKKKHKQRRKKPDVDDIPETEINDISVILTNNLSIISPNVSLDAPPGGLKFNNNDSTISEEEVKSEEKENISSKMKEPVKNGKDQKINAFQLMMNSMNRSIGGNSPGKDQIKSPELDETEKVFKKAKAQRKLVLEQWADKKGASKRRLDDVAQEEYIHKQMNKRAKRLKKLVENMGPKNGNDSEDSEVEELPVKKKLREQPRKIMIEDDSEDSMDVTESPIQKEKDDFVEKLSSPIKKKDSLLGYFCKIDKKTPTGLNASDSTASTSRKSKSPRLVSTPTSTRVSPRKKNDDKEKAVDKNTRKSDPIKSSDKIKDSCENKKKEGPKKVEHKIKESSKIKKPETGKAKSKSDSRKSDVKYKISGKKKTIVKMHETDEDDINEEEEKPRKRNSRKSDVLKDSAKKKSSPKKHETDEDEEKKPLKRKSRQSSDVIKDSGKKESPVKMHETDKDEDKKPRKRNSRQSSDVIKDSSKKKSPVKMHETEDEEKTPRKGNSRQSSDTINDSSKKNSPVEMDEESEVEVFVIIDSPIKENKETRSKRKLSVDEKSLEKFEEIPQVETLKKEPKKKGRRRLSEKQTPVIEREDKPIDESVTSSGRPKRSCTSKIKSYDSLISPEKAKPKNKKDIVTPLKIINLQSPRDVKVIRSPRIYDVDDERSMSPTLNTPKRRNVKLAPLFMKKPLIDPVVLKARQDFLMSGIPDIMRVEMDKQKFFEETIMNDSPIFPLISHVLQFPLENEEETETSTLKLNDLMEFDLVIKTFSLGSFTDCSKEDLSKSNVVKKFELSSNIPKIDNYRTIVLNLKEKFGKFPTNKCFKVFKKKFESGAILPPIIEEKLTKKKRKSRKSSLDDSLEIIEVEPNVQMENGDALFTEKYKPQDSEQIYLNHLAVDELKKFLQTWQDEKRSVNYDSDFESSNSSFSCSMACNYMVLVGACGTGKTSGVYALANELNFNVLEINASSRRKGKIILQELQEATQSHRVRKLEAPAPEVFKKKSKKRRISSDSESGSSGNDGHKMSLILIEDADIVFESDEGFVSAINQLIITSKRPIVLTTTNENCPHLSKYIANNSIAFSKISINGAFKYMSLMSLAENVFLDQEELAKLYVLNKKDFRKSINELQFFVQSGGDMNNGKLVAMEVEPVENSPQEVDLDEECSRDSVVTAERPVRKHKDIFNFFVKNQNQEQMINSPVNFDNLWCNMKKSLTKTENLDEILSLYDNISMAAKIQDSRIEEDRLVVNLNEEIAHELVERSYRNYVNEYDGLIGNSNDERLTVSSVLGINTIPSRSTYTDYEPVLRQICRSERTKSSKDRRGNRFYHYFRNYSNVSSSFGMDQFDVYCDIFS